MQEPQQFKKSRFACFCGYLCIFAVNLRTLCGKTVGIFVEFKAVLEFPGDISCAEHGPIVFFLQIQKNPVCFNVYSGLVHSKAVFERLSCLSCHILQQSLPTGSGLIFLPFVKQVHFVCQHAETPI